MTLNPPQNGGLRSGQVPVVETVTPERVDIYLTHRCNLACPFCYYRGFQKEERRDLSLEEWKRFIDELAELNVMRVSLYGGEPLIRADLPELIRHIVKSRMRFHIISNGTLLTDEFAAFIASTGRCDYFQISIDGLEAEHDAIRGAGSWKKAVRALEILHRHAIPTRVNMVASRGNFRRIVDAAAFLAETVKPGAIRINLVVEYGNALLPEEVGMLSDAEVAELIRLTLPLRDRFPRVFDRSAPLKFYSVITKPVRSGSGGVGEFRRCANLWSALTVRADGAVLTCAAAEHNVLGYINRDRIGELWKKSPLLLKFRDFVLAGQDAPRGDACRECPYTWYCRQKCPAAKPTRRYCYREIAKHLEGMS